MFVVTNTIKVKAAYAQKISAQFAKRHTKESMKEVTGFINFELMQRSSPTDPDIIEIVVLSRWETRDHQKNWVKSTSFKKLHPKKKEQSETDKKEKSSPILSNKIAEYDVIL